MEELFGIEYRVKTLEHCAEGLEKQMERLNDDEPLTKEERIAMYVDMNITNSQIAALRIALESEKNRQANKKHFWQR